MSFAQVLSRFWSKVDTSGGANACWPWSGMLVGGGYGRLMVDGRPKLTHRFSYELAYGPILQSAGHTDFVVMHKCDNRSCVNPRHLKLGNQTANVADMDKKGRRKTGSMKGSCHPRSKLDEDKVRAICADPASHAEVARTYGVTSALVIQLRQGQGWSHVVREPLAAYASGKSAATRGQNNKASKLTDDIVRAIRASDERPSVLAREYGVIPDYITAIRKRRVWKHVD